jgi:hypothetical protein
MIFGAEALLKEIIMSYTEGTYLEEIIDRAVDGWARILGFDDPYDRGRESDGTFKADDKTTPDVNEAWKSGKSPILRRTITITKKKVTKKTKK